MKRLPLLLAWIAAALIAACATPDAVPRPDLSLSLRDGAPTSYSAGQTIELTLTLRNGGSADAPATRLDAFLAGANRPGPGAEPSLSLEAPALAAGAEHELALSLVLPALSPGEHSLWLKADGAAELGQPNTENDWLRFRFQVVVPIANPEDCEATPAAIVTVPDPNLRAAMVTATRRDTGSEVLSCENLAQVEQLNVRNLGIGSLEGLQYLSGATVLTFSNAPFPNADRQLIGRLVAIERLTLEKLPQLTHIDFAAHLPKLNILTLRETLVSDLSPLQGLRDLEVVWADDNRISSLAQLHSLPSLRQFSARNNSITTIGNLANLSSLERLDLGDNAVTNLGSIGSMTQLVSLDLRGNGIGGVAALSGLVNLEVLNLARNNISSAGGLEGLAKVRELTLAVNQLSDLTAIGSMASLTHLILFQNRIGDLSGLAGLSGLRQLDVSNNAISDLRPLGPGLFSGPGSSLRVQHNCLGTAASLYTHNTVAIRNLMNAGVAVSYEPFAETSACD